MKLCKKETVLKNGDRHAVLWQANEELPEPALVIRTWETNLIEIQQGEESVLINAESVPGLTAVLRSFAAQPKQK